MAAENQEEPKPVTEPSPEEKIDATFRNGSLTAAGIILGFSLSFMSHWASNPNDWSRIDILPMLLLTVGIAVQVKVFADLLARDSLIAAKYDRARRLFLIGIAIVAAGIGLALLNDIMGLGSMPMLG
ncbi:putative transmemrbane protein [Rhizobium mesoamericanum STM3625]|uniref:Putative transmemrbane protein n=1 Tax=Rhizobium mesoamericanum STM3625 TaxID=1211777 RepID=K0PZN4_9HYPH|nr:putative transmemrbane protein [Rhizobium mesoamericanum STM3625]